MVNKVVYINLYNFSDWLDDKQSTCRNFSSNIKKFDFETLTPIWSNSIK